MLLSNQPTHLISIHAPRVGSDALSPLDVLPLNISIHAPRVGSDSNHPTVNHAEVVFQSTLPVWGATAYP